METTIPADILDQAVHCPFSYGCSFSPCFPKCDVEYRNGKNILFVNSGAVAECRYRVPFGLGHICRCPVHFYLFEERWDMT